MAPEVHLLHQVSTKSDVYSFGVLLIQIVSGKETFNVEEEAVSLRDFIKWAKSNYVEGEFEDIMDGVINNSIVDLNHNEAQKLMKIALECIQVQNFNLHKVFSYGY
jgi:serine/threonine protein kinase